MSTQSHAQNDQYIEKLNIQISKTLNLLKDQTQFVAKTFEALQSGKSKQLQFIVLGIVDTLNSGTAESLSIIEKFRHNFTERENGIFKSIKMIEQNLYEVSLKLENTKKFYHSTFQEEKQRKEQNIKSLTGELNKISKDIKLFSINSVVVSSHAGGKGAGFKSISRFIIELADTIDKLTIKINEYEMNSKTLYLASEDLLRILSEELYSNTMINSHHKLLNKLQLFKKKFNWLADIFGQIENRWKHSLKEFTKQTRLIFPDRLGSMSETPLLITLLKHFQPIIAGYDLNYLQKTLTEIMNHPMDDNDFREEIIKLLHTLFPLLYSMNEQKEIYQRMGDEIQYNLDHVLPYFRSFLEDFSELQQDIFYLNKFLYKFNYVSADHPEKVDSEGFLPNILKEIRETYQEYKVVLRQEYKIRNLFLDLLKKMLEHYYRGDALLDEFGKILRTMSNINVLAQIEMNKQDSVTLNNPTLRKKFLDILESFEHFQKFSQKDNSDILNKSLQRTNFLINAQYQQSYMTENIFSTLDQISIIIKRIFRIIEKFSADWSKENQKLFMIENTAYEDFEAAKQNFNGIRDLGYNFAKQHSEELSTLNQILSLYNINLKTEAEKTTEYQEFKSEIEYHYNNPSNSVMSQFKKFIGD